MTTPPRPPPADPATDAAGPPATDAAGPDAAALWRALKRLPGRTAQLLMFRYVDARTDAETATLYGMPPEAFFVHAARALAALDEALRSPSDGPVLPRSAVLAPETEVSLTQQLRSPAALATPDGAHLRQLADALRSHGKAIQSLAEQQAREDERSPARRRSDVLRRLALLALIAAALWLYLRQGR